MSIHNDTCITTATDGKEAHDFTRKRKRGDELQCAIDRRPFTIQTDSTDPFAKPRTFTPSCLLSRSNLPLAYLDTAQGSRMFAAHVQILEACHDFQDETNVLVVEDEGEGRLYAIERVQRRRYALCRLGAWVNTDDVEQRSNMDVRPDEAPRKRHVLKNENSGLPWWMSAAVEEKTEDLRRDSIRGRLPSLFMQSPRAAVATEQTLEMPDDSSLLRHSLDTAEPDATKVPTPDEALEELTRHYLDALYLSRTPLAYFTKGPLARARTAFASSPTDLVTFLRQSILSSSVMDKKFREVIAEHVKEMPSFDAEASATKPKSKRKRKWKAKRDKSGFFVDEKDHVEQWWQKDDDSGGSPNAAGSTDAVLKRRSPRLRNRETFLQIILILEILALEAAMPPSELPTASEPQDADSQAQESQVLTEGKKPRKKKGVDLSVMLESLIDRLCIWYSLETTTPIKPGANGSGDTKDETSDDLKSFCTEVILPFYGGRIPDQANSTSKKLGGPSVPKPASQRVSAASRKPGEPAVRRAPEKKPRKPLARVSTDTLNNVGTRPPLLHRSATDSAALSPCIKQEEAEPPSLDRIPLARPRSQPQVPAFPKPRASLLQQVSFNKREVDLSAMSQANEEKKRKKAKVQEQIKDAIGTLRKPNRALAVVEVAKNADESFAKAIARGKTSSRTTHSQRIPKEKTSIAVTATPRHIKATPLPRRQTDRGSYEKSTQLVPASSTRLFAGRSSDVVPSSSFAIPQTTQKPSHRTTMPSIEETPSRGFAKFMPAALARPPGTLLESPTVRRTAAPISETPSRPLRMPGLMETPKVRQPVGLRRVAASPAQVLASPVVGRDAELGLGSGGKSIYGALGWDEEEYEELS